MMIARAKGATQEMKPRIGITPSPAEDVVPHGTSYRNALSTNYSDAVEAAGGIPLILPPQHADNVSAILDALDGVLLSGGGDIRPALYGDESTHPKTYGIHDLRDSFEIALAREAITRDMPVLCICRGIQLLNVALSGTLIQDVADQWGPEIQHRQSELGIPASEPSHTVVAEPESLLARVYGTTSIATNSFHHQALRDLSPELVAIGRAPDGIVESVERPGSTWVLGVQWHPEMMFRAHEEHLRPFAALIEAAVGAHREAVAADD